jgi:hypothetical protein
MWWICSPQAREVHSVEFRSRFRRCRNDVVDWQIPKGFSALS